MIDKNQQNSNQFIENQASIINISFSDIISKLSSLLSINIDTADLNSSSLNSLSSSDWVIIWEVSYIKAAALADSIKEENTSWVWKHDTELIATGNKKKKLWLCN